MLSKCLLATIAASIALSCAAQAEPARWVIRDKDSTIYLIGTVHLLRHETEWSSAKVKKALAESGELWLEVADMDNQAAALPLIQQAGFDREKTLSSQLNFVQRDKLNKVAATYNIPMAALQSMRPWTAALTLIVLPLRKAGFDPNAGIDLFLKKEAEKKGETIRGFETLEEQTKFFAELPLDDQIAFLEEAIDDAEKGIALIDKLAIAWLKGDTKLISNLVVDEMKAEAPGLYEKLLVQRNARWSEQIARMLDGTGVQLVAVGVLHLVGPDSLQAHLGKRGIKTEPY